MYFKVNNTTYTLDTNAITLRSLKHNNVELPYTGKLPFGKDQPEKAWLSMIVQPEAFTWPYSPVRILLRVKTPAGMEKYRVYAEDDEINEIFWKLFADPNNEKTGLDPYWEGHWQTMFMVWSREREIEKAKRLA